MAKIATVKEIRAEPCKLHPAGLFLAAELYVAGVLVNKWYGARRHLYEARRLADEINQVLEGQLNFNDREEQTDEGKS